jgi:hypothetical protein
MAWFLVSITRKTRCRSVFDYGFSSKATAEALKRLLESNYGHVYEYQVEEADSCTPLEEGDGKGPQVPIGPRKSHHGAV